MAISTLPADISTETEVFGSTMANSAIGIAYIKVTSTIQHHGRCTHIRAVIRLRLPFTAASRVTHKAHESVKRPLRAKPGHFGSDGRQGLALLPGFVYILLLVYKLLQRLCHSIHHRNPLWWKTLIVTHTSIRAQNNILYSFPRSKYMQRFQNIDAALHRNKVE